MVNSTETLREPCDGLCWHQYSPVQGKRTRINSYSRKLMDVLPTLNKHANSVMTIENRSVRPNFQRTLLTGSSGAFHYASIDTWFIIETR